MHRIVKYVEVQRITSTHLRDLRDALPPVYYKLFERVLLKILEDVGKLTDLSA